MIEYITNCPCCNRQLKIVIDEASGEIETTSFFDKENTENVELIKQLEEKGIYFGEKIN